MRSSIALAILLVAVATPARAQQVDSRWEPWLGCWQMLDDRVRDENPSGADAVAAARARMFRGTTDVNVCVTRGSQPNTVTLTTRASGERAFEQTIVADAAAHPISEGACTGSQRAEWSADGYRLFAHAELTCATQPARTVSGLTMIATDGTWLDVQAIGVGATSNVRVRRYRRTSSTGGAGSATAVAHASLGLDDVKEASTKVASPVLEAALIESGTRFRLDRRVLVDLDDAKVPATVIDLMVALSYPDRFQVERRIETSADAYPPAYAGADSSGLWGLGYPYFSWYPNYFGNYSSYYSPFGYAYPGLYGLYSPYTYYPGYPGSFVVGSGAAPPPPAANAAEGRAVNGLGYTRIRPREAVPTESGGGGERSSGRSVDRGGSVSTSGYSSGGSGSSSGGGGSSGGSGGSGGSGSSGGSGGGRTAQPR
jgi:hypothetical protein